MPDDVLEAAEERIEAVIDAQAAIALRALAELLSAMVRLCEPLSRLCALGAVALEAEGLDDAGR